MNNFPMVGNGYEPYSELSRMGSGHRYYQGQQVPGQMNEYQRTENSVGKIQGMIFGGAFTFFACLVFPPVILIVVPVLVLIALSKVSEGHDNRVRAKRARELDAYIAEQERIAYENQFRAPRVQERVNPFLPGGRPFEQHPGPIYPMQHKTMGHPF